MAKAADLQTSSLPSAKNTPMRHYGWSTERRRFVRFPGAWKIRFCMLTEKNGEIKTAATPFKFHSGKCKDLSQGGLKLISLEAVPRNAILLVEFDPNLFSKHITLERLLRVEKGKLIAKVVWRSLDLNTSLFHSGLHLIEIGKRSEYEPFVALAREAK